MTVRADQFKASIGEWVADLTGTFDWKASGDDSADPDSGIIVRSSDLADFTALEVGSGVITWDVSASGADKVARLEAALVGLPDLHLASSLYLEMDLDLVDAASNFDTLNDQITISIQNQPFASAESEAIWCTYYSDGAGNIRILSGRTVNNAYAGSGNSIVTNAKNAGRLQVVDNIGHQYSQFYEDTGHNLTQSGALTQTTQHCRTGVGAFIEIYLFAADGGRSAGTISNIKITVR